MKKMLYIMGIEWNWIFQRPQIFALELQKDYEVTVVCPKQLVHGKHQNNTLPERLIELVQIPFQEKNDLIGFFANKMHRHALGNLSDYDLIWVGYPLFARYIPKDYQGAVIYDCMDNFEALYPDQSKKAINNVLAVEKELLNRADIVFTSSQKLKDKLLKVCPDKKIDLVRNGYSNIAICQPENAVKKDVYTLGYIGTISEWFDSSVVEASLRTNTKIRYNLVGPISRHQVIVNPKVIYSGVVEHGKLSEFVSKIDCLIMPFVTSEIVLYVDPVKLYEYIAWGKCIVASWYPEIDRFEDYVYFYHNEQEYLQIIEDLADKGFPPKYAVNLQREFLMKNTWEERVKAIKEVIELREKV